MNVVVIVPFCVVPMADITDGTVAAKQRASGGFLFL